MNLIELFLESDSSFSNLVEFLCRVGLVEAYYGIDPNEYNRLFSEELDKLLQRIKDPVHRQSIEQMRDFNWIGYISSSVRGAGYRDPREIQEKTHDVATKLLIGTLFRGFDERASGPIGARFKTSVTNAIRNIAAKDKNRRKYLPSLSIQPDDKTGKTSGTIAPDALPDRNPQGNEKVIGDFRKLVNARLGSIGTAILDARLEGQETKSIIGRSDVGYPDKNIVKKIVRGIKDLAREYAQKIGDDNLVMSIDRAMGKESQTVQKRLAAVK